MEGWNLPCHALYRGNAGPQCPSMGQDSSIGAARTEMANSHQAGLPYLSRLSIHHLSSGLSVDLSNMSATRLRSVAARESWKRGCYKLGRL